MQPCTEQEAQKKPLQPLAPTDTGAESTQNCPAMILAEKLWIRHIWYYSCEHREHRERQWLKYRFIYSEILLWTALIP